jgi:hypothetical protein
MLVQGLALPALPSRYQIDGIRDPAEVARTRELKWLISEFG